MSIFPDNGTKEYRGDVFVFMQVAATGRSSPESVDAAAQIWRIGPMGIQYTYRNLRIVGNRTPLIVTACGAVARLQ
jgi:hypothetical protein